MMISKIPTKTFCNIIISSIPNASQNNAKPITRFMAPLIGISYSYLMICKTKKDLALFFRFIQNFLKILFRYDIFSL